MYTVMLAAQSSDDPLESPDDPLGSRRTEDTLIRCASLKKIPSETVEWDRTQPGHSWSRGSQAACWSHRSSLEMIAHGPSSVFLSIAYQVHGGHRTGRRHLLQPQGQDASGEDRLHLLWPPWPHLCPPEKPLLPKELSDCWRLDSPHLV